MFNKYSLNTYDAKYIHESLAPPIGTLVSQRPPLNASPIGRKVFKRKRNDFSTWE